MTTDIARMLESVNGSASIDDLTFGQSRNGAVRTPKAPANAAIMLDVRFS